MVRKGKASPQVIFEEHKLCSARRTQKNIVISLCTLHTDHNAHCVDSLSKKLGEVKLGDTAVPALPSIHHEHKISADEKNEPVQATSSTEKVKIEDPTDEGKTEGDSGSSVTPFLIFFFFCFTFFGQWDEPSIMALLLLLLLLI